jgi:hypothetical protein
MMPAINYGHGGANQLDGRSIHPGTHALRQSTIRSLVADLGGQLAQNGFTRASPVACWSLDEAAAKLRTGNLALIEATEHAIPSLGNTVVYPVQYRLRKDAQQDSDLPGPAEFGGNEERGVTPAQHLSVIRSMVRNDVKRGEFVGVAAETFDH